MTPATKNYVGATMIGIGLFGLVAFAWPTYNNLSVIRSGLVKINTDRENAISTVDKINKIKTSYEQKTVIKDRVALLVPESKETAEIISTIEDMIAKTGVRLSKLSLGESKAKAESLYSPINIEMTMGGSYSALKTFIIVLEKNIRLFDIANIQVGRDNQNIGQLNFKINAGSYYLKSDAPTSNK
jgi:Tfp pilus assembly protein PilO